MQIYLEANGIAEGTCGEKGHCKDRESSALAHLASEPVDEAACWSGRAWAALFPAVVLQFHMPEASPGNTATQVDS